MKENDVSVASHDRPITTAPPDGSRAGATVSQTAISDRPPPVVVRRQSAVPRAMQR
jgi:hypothetical protein